MAEDVFQSGKFIGLGKLKDYPEADEQFQSILNKYNIKDPKTLRLCLIRWGEDNDYLPKKKNEIKAKKVARKSNQFEMLSIEFDISEIKSFKDQFGKKRFVKDLISNLRLIIWKYTKLPCVISFSEPRTEGEKTIIEGRCPLRRCNGLVVFETIENGEKLRLSWTQASGSVKHEDKARLTGEAKSKVLDMLDKEPPVVVHSNLVSEHMDDNDETCPLVPYIRNMYQMKYRNRIETTTSGSADSIRNIAQMRGNPEFHDCIDEVCYVPFSVMYSTPSQQRFSKEESRGKNGSCIAIDSTGVSLILPPECEISTRTNTLKRCMLYNIVMLGAKTSKPVYQMLTQRHTSTQISRMLDTFKIKQHHDKNPKEVFIDESAALFLACVKTFTPFDSANEYIDYGYDRLVKGEKASMVYIRIDRSHVVKTIKRNKDIKKLNKVKTMFYQRALGFIIQIKDFEEAKTMMTELFRCINEPFLNSDDTRRAVLIRKIDSHKPLEFPDDDDKIEIEDPFDCESNEICADIKRNKFYTYVQQLANPYLNQKEPDADKSIFESLKSMKAANTLYAPSIHNAMVNIFAKLTIYGDILQKSFGTTIEIPTSSAAEVTFRVMKDQVFRSITKLAPDRWISKHLKFLIGCISGEDIEMVADDGDVSSDSESSKSSTIFESSTSSNDSDEFDGSIKNDVWKNINENQRKQRKKISQRCQTSILNPNTTSDKIPIFTNSYETQPSKGKRNNNHKYATRMCSSNSVLHFDLACYADFEEFRDIVDQTKEGAYFALLRAAMAETKQGKLISRTTNDMRIEFLYDFLSNDLHGQDKKDAIKTSTATKGRINMDCLASTTQIIQMIMKRQPERHSVLEIRECPDCEDRIGDMKFHDFMPMQMKEAKIENMSDFFKRSRVAPKMCDKCNKIVPASISLTPNSIVAIEAGTFLSKYNEESKTTEIQPTKLENIEKSFQYNQYKFYLKGVINYLPATNHFIVHVLRNNAWKTYDDLQGVYKSAINLNAIRPSAIFYQRKHLAEEYRELHGSEDSTGELSLD